MTMAMNSLYTTRENKNEISPGVLVVKVKAIKIKHFYFEFDP